jgi:hypothetical protein
VVLEVSGENNDHDLDYEGGFLSTTQREYLAEDTEKTLDDYSNPYQWWSRVKPRFEGALMDLALLGSSEEVDEQWMKQASQKQLNQMGWQYKENAPLAGMHAAKGIASSYDDGELMRLIHPMEDIAREVRQNRDFTQKFLVKAILRVLENGNPDDDEIIQFLAQYWPDKERVLEIAEKELSDS